MPKIELLINKPFRNPITKKDHRIGETIKIEVTDDGIPINSYYRDRLKDAKIDNCCTIVDRNPQKSEKTQEVSSESKEDIEKKQTSKKLKDGDKK